ncbi:hypothetical protein Celaphus_00008330 [Cervus elaphus hippelaphus]|uniref:Uncharacterized protein n=1 Tax=Cervus elaphus hippelaphus TaxID=46360 RepID=A0A212CPZ4_CEREH|nr:hypothetical protein Celaphus_00008330 [Cervus elaphus hippelaphus]
MQVPPETIQFPCEDWSAQPAAEDWSAAPAAQTTEWNLALPPALGTANSTAKHPAIRQVCQY